MFNILFLIRRPNDNVTLKQWANISYATNSVVRDCWSRDMKQNIMRYWLADELESFGNNLINVCRWTQIATNSQVANVEMALRLTFRDHYGKY